MSNNSFVATRRRNQNYVAFNAFQSVTVRRNPGKKNIEEIGDIHSL